MLGRRRKENTVKGISKKPAQAHYSMQPCPKTTRLTQNHYLVKDTDSQSTVINPKMKPFTFKKVRSKHSPKEVYYNGIFETNGHKILLVNRVFFSIQTESSLSLQMHHVRYTQSSTVRNRKV